MAQIQGASSHGEDRAVVNGAASVSAVPASVPSAAPPRCIVCDRSFEGAVNCASFDRIPYAGTLFRTNGHYGSTAFDSFDGHALEIAVCDLCLVSRLAGRVFLHAPMGGGVAEWDGYSDNLLELAQGMAARSDETHSGSAVGNSPVGTADAPDGED